MNKGFTIVELLISIAIIAILIGLLLPVLTQSKKGGYKAICESNLRTIGQTVRMYLDDYDGEWPDSNVWSSWNCPDKVFPGSSRGSLPKLAGCPLVNVPQERKFEIQIRGYIVGYACNSVIDTWNDVIRVSDDGIHRQHNPTTDKDIVFPATTVLFFDAGLDTVATYKPDPYEGAVPYPYNMERGFERHNGGGNYLFCDNHVQWLKKDQVLWGSEVPKLVNDGTKPSFALSTRDNK